MKKVFIDTNIIIDYSKGFDKSLKHLFFLQKQNFVKIFVNSIVIAEFFNDKSLKNIKKLDRANRLFQYFTVLELTGKSGFLAGRLLRTNQVNFIADSLIAATCLDNGLELMTNNKKDFKKVKGLKFYEEKGLIE